MGSGAVTVRAMIPDDWTEVRAIYQEGIASGHATFESSAPDWQDWNAGHLNECRLVATDGTDILGWAALSAVSGRCVYAGVAEVSVYVAAGARGQGVGKRLLTELVTQSEQLGLWTLQAGIFPENEPSLAIHRHCGFRIVGTREKLGQMGGRWRDVLLLERRSTTVDVIGDPGRVAHRGRVSAAAPVERGRIPPPAGRSDVE